LSKIGSIGILLPRLEARLVVDGDGNGDIDAAVGAPGEIWIRGPSIMKVSSKYVYFALSRIRSNPVALNLQGYLNNPEATKDAITTDKWFKTGDIAIRDKDGFYYIVDRRKELIKYKGFQGLFLSRGDI
jgi:acyl-CoA synthetase (AMP-forming)/AMP-acid ligase II